MGRESELRTDISEIDKEIRSNYWMRKFVAVETGGIVGVTVWEAGFQPEHILPLVLTSLGLILAGGGLTVWLKESEKRLRSLIKKTSEESVK